VSGPVQEQAAFVHLAVFFFDGDIEVGMLAVGGRLDVNFEAGVRLVVGTH
jgi:hypothetical protein